MRTVEGAPEGAGVRVAIVASRFDKSASGVPERLIGGALAAARAHGVADWAIDVVRVPGAFELPLAAERLAATGRYDAIVCAGVIIRGETAHFDLVAGEAARGIATVGRAYNLPVTFGVITADTEEQALARAGDPQDGSADNLGREAMLAALEMATLFRRIDDGESRGRRNEPGA